MGKLLLVACTNVGRYIIEEFMTNRDIGAELVGVINLNSEQGISKANYDSYADLVIKYGLKIHYCNNINDDETVAFMKELSPDVILQSGWSQKFSDEVLQLPKYGCIGEHPAPLPKGRGAACVNWAILTGETKWGDSYFKMVSEYDKGDLYAQYFFNIEPYDTVYTVYEKVAQCAMKAVSTYASQWCNGIFDVIKQDENKVTYYKRRKPTDGEITDFSQDAVVLHNFIRAQTRPYPGAYVTTSNGKMVILQSSIIENEKVEYSPGTVYGKSQNGGILVAAKNGTVLEIIRVQFENQPSIWADEILKSKATPFDLFDCLCN